MDPQAKSPNEVRLRPVTETDLPIFYENQLDPVAVTMAAFPSSDYERFMTHWRRIMSDADIILRTILLDGQVAGNIVCFWQDGRQEVGYWLGRDYWGLGVATRALAAFLQEVDVRPLYAHVAKHNIASRRVLEKCGFSIYGKDRTLGDSSRIIEEFVLKLDASP